MYITVFTPTYNRAYLLGRLYASLKKQSWREFEWIIIDDGSSDDTEKLVCSWQKEKNDFPILYYKKENGGKCRAINDALDLAAGELFFTVDSDDRLTEDALLKVAEWEAAIPHDGTYCGIAGNIGHDTGKTSNTLFEGGYYDGTLLDRYRNVDGERALIFYTDIHRAYKYPAFPGETFMTEAVVWNRMAHDGFRMRFYNDVIWLYEYREDGLTMAGSRLFLDNPGGYCLWMKEKSVFEKWPFVSRLRLDYTLICELYQRWGAEKTAQSLKMPVILTECGWRLHRVLQWIKRHQ